MNRPRLIVEVALDLQHLSTAWQAAMLHLALAEPETGKTYSYDFQTSKDTGLVGLELLATYRRSTGLWSFPPQADYTSSEVATDCDESGCRSAAHQGKCTLSVDTWNYGGVTNGTYTCTDLPHTYSPDRPKPFGRTMSISGNWNCDGYSL